jgi:PRC-barrel domain
MSDDEHQIGYKVLPRGTPVLTSDGQELGTVSKVLDNAREHIFDGIVVATKDGKRFVDAPEVDAITTKRVLLTIDAAQAADLPEHKGVLGQAEKAAKRRADRLRRRFGR